MTVTKHYAQISAPTAFAGTRKVESGDVSMDVSRWPHVEATVRTTATPGLWAALDPRTSPRRVTLECGETVQGVHRSFDLDVRSAHVRAGGLLELRLASDEAILADYSPPTDDAPWAYLDTHGWTASALSNFVLDNIGATVNPPSPDPSIMPAWELTNHAFNPNFAVNAKGAKVRHGAVTNVASDTRLGERCLRWTSPAGGSSMYVAGIAPDGQEGQIRVAPGQWVYVTARVASVDNAHTRALVVRFANESFTQFSESATQFAAAPGWMTVELLLQAGPGETRLDVAVWAAAAAAARNVYVRDVCVVMSPIPVPAFSGDTLAGGGYTYVWDGLTNDSTSTRIPAAPREVESLVWRAEQSGMDYLSALLQPVGLRLVCNENRVWSLRHNDHVEPGSVTIAAGDNMTDFDIGAEVAPDAATVTYKWREYGVDFVRADSFQLGPNPRKRVRRERNMPYPGAGLAEQIVRRAQTRIDATAQAVSQWHTNAEQSLTIISSVGGHLDGTNGWVPDADVTLTGTIGSVTFDLASDEMTVSVRLEETP